MMWKIFWEKEKTKPLLNILYLYLLILFAGSILDPAEGDYVVNGVMLFYMMMVASTLDPLSLMWFISSNHESSLTNPSYNGLEVNLKMLSISFNEFTKFNCIYALLKTLPFLILLIILGGNSSHYITYIAFASIVVLINILIPLNKLITHNNRNIALDNRQESKKNIKLKIKDNYETKYPSYNSRITYYVTILIPIFFVIMLIGMNSLIFHNYHNPTYILVNSIMAIVGTIFVVAIGFYQYIMVFKSEDNV